MEYLIPFLSMGLLVYWLQRVWFMQHASDDAIDEMCEVDVAWYRHMTAALYFAGPKSTLSMM